MLEPPDVPEAAILAAVRTAYNLAPVALDFLPLGQDNRSFAFKLTASATESLFLKLRAGPLNQPSLIVPRYLHDQDVPGIVAPLRTAGGALWTTVADYTLALYPFIEGVTGADHGMTERHWTAFGALLRRVHDVPLSPDLATALHRENFAPSWRARAEQLDALITTEPFTDPISREFADFWRERRSEIRRLLDRAAVLAALLRTSVPPLVLCHADIHTWNLLIDRDERPWIVDWDDTQLAPCERDLMFAVGGLGRHLVSAETEAWFLTGYGPVQIDRVALTYYRYARALDDLTVCASTVLLMPDRDAATRQTELDLARDLFAPGRLVTLAYEADTNLPV